MTGFEVRGFTILHISDLHFKSNIRHDQDVILSGLLKKMSEMRESEWCPDLILCTGDVAYSGKPSEYEPARDFLDHLLNITGITKKRLFVVPGNHDVDWDEPSFLPEVELCKDEDSDNFFESRDILKSILKKFHGYHEFSCDYLEQSFDENHHYFTKIVEIKGFRVGIAGFNSAWPLYKELYKKSIASKQLLGRIPLMKALQNLQGADLKIVMFHHPLVWLLQFEQPNVGTLLEESADLVLNGHQDKSRMEIHHVGEKRKVLYIQAGPAYGEKPWPNRVHLIRWEIQRNDKIVRIHPLKFDHETNKWDLDTAIFSVKDYPDYIGRYEIGKELENPKLGPFSTIEEKIRQNTKQRRFPAGEHFEEGLIHFDKKEIEETEKTLKSKRCYLIYGPPSSRKTTFSLSFGLYLRRKGYSVFYREVEGWAEWNALAERTKPYDDEKVLFIIDECQNSPETIGKFVCWVKVNIENAKFLFLSKMISKDRFLKQRFNYFAILESESKKAWEDLKQKFKDVIKQFCISNKIENYEEQIGNVEDIIKTCGNKFIILNELLGVWKRFYQFEKILSEIPKQKIYEKVRLDYLQTYPRAIILTKLCVIYQFEGTPIPPQGMNVLLIDATSKDFKELEDEGLIYKKTSKNTQRIYFTVHDDPTFAKLILEAVEQTGLLKLIFPQFSSINEFSFKILKGYLCEVKEHITLLLDSIYKSGDLETGEKLIQNVEVISALADYLKLVKTPDTIRTILTCLRRFKIREKDKEIILSKDVLEQWSKNISKISLSSSLPFMLRELKNFKPEKAEEFLEMISPEEVAEISKKRMFEREKPKNVGILTSIVRYFGWISKGFSSTFLNHFTEEELLNLINNSKMELLEKGKHKGFCNQIYGFIQHCGFSTNVKNAYGIFLDQFNEKELLSFLETLDLIHDGMFIRVSYWNSKFQGAYKQFFKNFLPEKIKKAPSGDIMKYLSEISDIIYEKKRVSRILAKETTKLLEMLNIFINETPPKARPLFGYRLKNFKNKKEEGGIS